MSSFGERLKLRAAVVIYYTDSIQIMITTYLLVLFSKMVMIELKSSVSYKR